MKASLKLELSQKPNANGFPIYKILRCSGKSPVKKTIFRCQPEHWNEASETITKQHPEYDFLIAGLLNIKSTIAAINTGRYNYDDAKQLLFGKKKSQSGAFYDVGLRLVDDSRNGKLYETVLNSFNSAYPGIAIDEITRSKAFDYMEILLKTNKPNGVHTYMRTLNAIFNKVKPEGLQNPFSGVRPKKEMTRSKHLTDPQLKKIFYTRTIPSKYDGKNDAFSINAYRYYFMLMFYLGGIDAVDLAHLRYDEHVNEGRVQFQRFKGGTNVYINNKIFPEAEAILQRFKCYPYLVPIHKYKSHNDFVSNMNDRFNNYMKDLRLGVRVLTKSARYSFINRAQQLLIDERITMELVGHAQQSTHSIYTNEFPLSVRDAAHEKIIRFI